jgi:hypothetical protein
MAYNRENLLKRIAEVREIVLEHRKHDTPQIKIYEKYIKDKFHISYSTFNEWLTISPHAQLKELQAKREKQKEFEKRQLNLFED